MLSPEIGRNFEKVRLVVVQPEDNVYFDKYYTNPLEAVSKFNYYCQLANISYKNVPEFIMSRTDKYNEMSAYFPHNEENKGNNSGFVQVSMYFEVAS
ncbi:MAG: hypothetical protein FWF59_03530 [Turicibacter sp.]|nr:hypothetical protein [Turicibacter sp.]